MARRRRGRRPGEHEDEGQPHVAPDGRPLRHTGGYTPPPSPLTRWQYHQSQSGQRGGRGERARWPGAGAPQRGDHRRFPSGTEQARRAEPRPRPTPPAPGGHRDASRAPALSKGGATIDAFDLFCAYHLGITADGSYKIQNIHEVARRFGTNAAELRQVLAGYGMAADDIIHSGFDLPSAQVDIMVAPEGISRRELARPWYDEFRGTPKQGRNWTREMEEAQRQIDQTIGRDGRWSPTPRDPTGRQS